MGEDNGTLRAAPLGLEEIRGNPYPGVAPGLTSCCPFGAIGGKSTFLPRAVSPEINNDTARNMSI